MDQQAKLEARIARDERELPASLRDAGLQVRRRSSILARGSERNPYFGSRVPCWWDSGLAGEAEVWSGILNPQVLESRCPPRERE